MAEETSTGGRATLRDVIEISGRVEKKVDDLTAALGNYAVSHEHRFTDLEADNRESKRRLTDVEDDVSTLKTEHAVAKGHVKALAYIAGGVLTLLAGVGGVGIAHAFGW